MKLFSICRVTLISIIFINLGLVGCGQFLVNNPSSSEINSYQLTNITEQEINYFEQIAFGNEFAENQQTQYIRKWTEDIRIKVIGSPTQDDLQTLSQVIGELNQLVDDIQLNIDSQEHNLEIYFVPENEFPQYEPNYVPGNLGFFFIWWNGNLEINRGKILISTDQVTQAERSHLIREELTQSLGLMNDALTYQDSIFYQDWTDVNQFSEIDKTVIKMLYNSQVQTGMTKQKVREVLRGL